MALKNTRTIKDRKSGINQLALRIIGLAATFLIGIGYLFPAASWMDGFRWFAFPIFAFMLNEGFEKTINRSLYARRLIIFALIAEIPYDLLVNGRILSYDSQNVLFTLFLGYAAITALDGVRRKLENTFVTLLSAAALAWAGYNLGKAFGMEMYGTAFIIMLAFNISGHVTYTRLLQFAVLMYPAYRSYSSALPLTDAAFSVPEPVFALAVLIFIWIYNGERGTNTIRSRYIFYAAYPCMLFVLWIVKLIVK